MIDVYSKIFLVATKVTQVIFLLSATGRKFLLEIRSRRTPIKIQFEDYRHKSHHFRLQNSLFAQLLRLQFHKQTRLMFNLTRSVATRHTAKSQRIYKRRLTITYYIYSARRQNTLTEDSLRSSRIPRYRQKDSSKDTPINRRHFRGRNLKISPGGLSGLSLVPVPARFVVFSRRLLSHWHVMRR